MVRLSTLEAGESLGVPKAADFAVRPGGRLWDSVPKVVVEAAA